MKKIRINPHLAIILATGSVWGMTEFLFGLGLQKCATLYTGAILTGIAFFWISFTWSVTRSIIPVLMITAIAITFKLFDAILLPVAWNHGSILNPIFAFLMQITGFILLISLFGSRFTKGSLDRVLLGAGAAAIAVALFPLVRFATGVPACLYAATNIPLVYHTAPVAIGITMITVPLGYFAAASYLKMIREKNTNLQHSFAYRFWSPAVIIGCLLVIILFRII
ncbi:MAG: hypothetical protein EHM46_01035 [Bacteroidetes bacterium]|nr:MAG: hypothetical protein EHM46_01035 [Bacteroidota bacterium]